MYLLADLNVIVLYGMDPTQKNFKYIINSEKYY